MYEYNTDMYIYIYIYRERYTYLYLYIHREREREREKKRLREIASVEVSMCTQTINDRDTADRYPSSLCRQPVATRIKRNNGKICSKNATTDRTTRTRITTSQFRRAFRTQADSYGSALLPPSVKHETPKPQTQVADTKHSLAAAQTKAQTIEASSTQAQI